MRIALALYRYFPHGGLQRDFFAVARRCVERGHSVTVLAAEWQGPPPDGMKLELLPVHGFTNHARMRRFARRLSHWRRRHPMDILAGFNRLPTLDLYFASDSCFRAGLRERPRPLQWPPRYRTYARLEDRAFAGRTRRILFLNRQQAEGYLAHYALAPERYRILPPGVRSDRRPGPEAAEQRRRVRAEFGIPDSARLVLFLGSGFRIKGLDRAIEALGSLSKEQKKHTFFLVVGKDDPEPFQRLVEQSGLADRTVFAGGREDVPALLQAADLLLHPAYRESAGMVLLEATVAGLPVLTTSSCGYAEYVQQAGSGRVLDEPFEQEALNRALTEMLARVPGPWAEAGLRYGEQDWLYSLHDRVVDEIEALGARHEA